MISPLLKEEREDSDPPVSDRSTRGRYSLLYRFILREFAQNFAVAFSFFFCIFFINSILLLVQRILLKNIDMMTMLEMVALSMPQFLIYTFPFASLAASSMVLGDLGSSNELLAIRSSGIASGRIYRPLIVASIFLSFVTFFFADVVLPWSSVVYEDRLSVLMQEMPTFEIESNSVNTVGNIVLSNGEAEGNVIHDIVLISTDEDTGESRTVLSERGTLELIDSWNYIYSLQLEKPEILISDRDDLESYGLSSAESAVFFLDFSEQIPSLTSSAPVNLSSRDLISGIQDRAVMEEEDIARWHHDREVARLSFAETLKNAGRGDASVSDITTAAAEATNTIVSRGNRIPRNFYSQYYKAELTKKFVLSAACFCLTLITLPLSMFRVKHGKLTGFAISLLIAVAYWYMLFGVQLEIFNISSSPYLLIALPDIAILLIAVVLIMRFRKAR